MVKYRKRFEWNSGNVIHLWVRHQVRPFEAEEALKDPDLLLDIDIEHSEKESRFEVIGRTKKHRTLFLAFTMRNNHIRIFHGRDATRKEVKLYEEEINRT